jgi:hypothetical protein
LTDLASDAGAAPFKRSCLDRDHGLVQPGPDRLAAASGKGSRTMRKWLAATLMGLLLMAPARAQQSGPALADTAFELFTGNRSAREKALEALVATGRVDVAPVLILALRFAPEEVAARIVAGLETLTGARPGGDWGAWMRWQEANPQTGVMPGFAKLQARLYDLIDPAFQAFLDGDRKHEIRLEEIAWGGVVKDGIPALTNPNLITAEAAAYLNAGDLVFGVAINGDTRAYPLRILDWHEMFNDVVGGVPVSLAYCTLCGSGILFETHLEGRKQPFVFGSSGFLYRSNKLMYDTETHSLWNQFTGRPVVGPLTGSGIELKARPVVITTWADWRSRHPGTRVLNLETGFRRDYRSGAAYRDYFASPELMFPTNVDQTRLKQKDYVFALRSSGAEKAWPLALFEGGAVINDRAGVIDLVLIGDAATRTVRAYRSEGLRFGKGTRADEVVEAGTPWRVTEDALVGPGGRTLPRLPGHIAYWFAWSGYLGRVGEVGTRP